MGAIPYSNNFTPRWNKCSFKVGSISSAIRQSSPNRGNTWRKVICDESRRKMIYYKSS